MNSLRLFFSLFVFKLFVFSAVIYFWELMGADAKINQTKLSFCFWKQVWKTFIYFDYFERFSLVQETL